MKRKIFMAFLFVSLPALAATESQPKMFVMCRLGGIVRTIQVNEASGTFETVYTKNGASKSIGNGKSYESCVGFLNNVKTNLEKSGWNCKEVSGVAVTKESSAQ